MSSGDEPTLDDPDRPGESQGELDYLEALQDQLREALQSSPDRTGQAELATELRWIRERIAELMNGGVPPTRPPEPGRTVHSQEVPSSLRAYPDYGHAGVPPEIDFDRAAGRWNPPGVDGGYDHRAAYPVSQPQYQGRRPSRWSGAPWLPVGAAFALGLLLAAVVGWALSRDGDDSDQVASTGSDVTEESSTDAAAAAAEIRAALDRMGFASVVVEERGDTIALVGSVATDAERQAAIGAASTLAAGLAFDASGLLIASDGDVTGAAAMQRELDRILAVSPINFDEGQVAVNERHQLVLNNVITTMLAYPDLSVTIVGYTDSQGSDEANERLSLSRAQNVKDYLVSQGVPADRLSLLAAGEREATGADSRGMLERRVEFEVVGAAAPADSALRVGLVAPSASNDLAFTQSMVDALNVLAGERGIDVSVTDSTFVEDDAELALRGYAEEGYDLVISHGSQFGAVVQRLALEYPAVAFAWGPGFDTFGSPNVYPYDARAQEGGYVLGALASLLTESSRLGVVGAIETGDGLQYISGFVAGAEAERAETEVLTEYTGSFSDVGLASVAATNHVDAGADILTGSAQMVVGAVDVAAANGIPWFATQANQTSLAPQLVVASQVYHWEVILRPILDDIESGQLAGRGGSLTLANQGLLIEYNDAFQLPAEVRQRGDELVAEISSGDVVPPEG